MTFAIGAGGAVPDMRLDVPGVVANHAVDAYTLATWLGAVNAPPELTVAGIDPWKLAALV